MARPVGVRNADFEQKRERLLDGLTAYALADGVHLPSMRQLSIAANSSQPTLCHYFDDRAGLVCAIIERLRETTRPVRKQMRIPGKSLEASVNSLLSLAADASQNRTYLRSHAFAIREGMVDPDVYTAYSRQLVDTAIDAIAERFVKSPGGPRNFANARSAAQILYFSLHGMAMRRALENQFYDRETFVREMRLLSAWFLKGFLANPDADITNVCVQ